MANKTSSKFPKFTGKPIPIDEPPIPNSIVSVEVRRKKIEDKFSFGKDFKKAIDNGAQPYNDSKIACIKRKELYNLSGLNLRSDSVKAVTVAVKRLLAKGGFLTKGAIIYDKKFDMICFDVGKIKVAPGETDADRALYATAAVMGLPKTASLFDTYSDVGLKVTVTDRDVDEWLKKSGIKKDRRRGRPF